MSKLRDDEKEFSHPAYGMIGIRRRSGTNGRLFGSSLKDHYGSVAITIHRAKRYHSLSYDRFSAVGCGQIIEVEMSAAQFAEMITTPNVGDGVPCTLRHVEGEQLPNIPEEDTLETEEIRDTFEKKIMGLAKEFRANREKVAKIIADRKLPKDVQKEILGIFDKAEQELGVNSTFVLDQFNEAAEKVITSAKAEVDNFVLHNVVQRGLKSLEEAQAHPLLPAKTEEKP